MKISKQGVDLIKEFEGFKSKPYLCPAGVPTIGYGATYYPSSGVKVKMDDNPITESEATKMLKKMIDNVYGSAVNRYTVAPTTQNQFDALVSFAYNLGVGALQRSTLMRKHNEGKYNRAAKEFEKWVNAGGRRLAGLVRRRKAEQALYLNQTCIDSR